MDRKKVLITRLCCVGDVIYSIPLIKTIKRNNPDVKITYVVTTWCKQIIEMVPEVDDVIVFDAPYQKISLFSKLLHSFSLCKNIFFGKYYIGINLHRNIFFPILFFFAKIKIRVGFGKSFFLNRKVFYDDTLHESKKFLSLLSSFNYKEIIEIPKISPSEEDLSFVDNLLLEYNIPKNNMLVGIYADGGRNPGQIMEIRQLSSEKYIEFIKNVLQKHSNITFLLINSKEGKGNAEKINDAINNQNCILLSNLTLKQIAALSTKCKTFIGGDTGILHLAAATGTRVIMFYGPDNPDQWAPLNEGNKIIFHKIDCSPCYTPVTVKDKNNFIGNTFICKRGDVLCMNTITVEEILNAFEEIISK